ncbi:MAG: anaerobic glycerol-3-phosphate dehydrogenase subunit GlpB [Veillonellales bacterium]
MRESDVIVIGSGFAGLIAAAAADKRGKKVTVLSKGVGTLTIGGGTIDLLGYGNDGRPLANPAAGLAAIEPAHPYKKIGSPAIYAAIKFFLAICESAGYPYLGRLEEMKWIPTAAGTLKPTCLVPKTMDTTCLKSAHTVYAAGFQGLKDYYPHLVAKNLSKLPGYDKNYEIVMVNPHFTDGRDVSALDVARWLDTGTGRKECIRQLVKKVKAGAVILMPPVLGTSPDYQVLEEMETALDCRLVETVAIPPSVTGFRLRSMMLNYLKTAGVRIIEQVSVARAIMEKGKCLGVVTQNIDRERTYYAKNFILANGGFYGGGLRAEPGQAIEPIFNLPVEAPAKQEEWGNRQLFSPEKQSFAKIGITVDNKMRPLAPNGSIAIENIFIAGRNLRGYDFCFEKSGNGVALASGYQAAMSV